MLPTQPSSYRVSRILFTVSDTAAEHLRDYILLVNIFLLTVFIIHKLRNWSKSKKKNF